MSHECNKFIISDGEFIRDFEGMYKSVSDPWGQRHNDMNDVVTKAALSLLKSGVNVYDIQVKKILDIGCADGYQDQRLSDLFPSAEIIGTDISETVIKMALERVSDKIPVQFIADDIREKNDTFVGKFDVIFSSKTLYYVGPEIDKVLDNIDLYIKPRGLFCFIYNQCVDAFSSKWLTYEGLREKIINRGYSEYIFIECDRFSKETTAVGIFFRSDHA